MKRILIFYITENSGHHKAALAVSNAIKSANPKAETTIINSINYINPILGRIVNSAYMSIIKNRPEYWGYLYDNPKVVKKSQKFRELLHKYNSRKMKKLIDSFNPDAVVCTQAFPCGLVADYKRSTGSCLKLYGVLTDYAPHAYWIHDRIDAYFVPAKETGAKLVNNGISSDKIVDSGIPIDPVFGIKNDRNTVLKKFGFEENSPIILLMGGSQGVGFLKEAYNSLMKVKKDLQVAAITGRNVKMYNYFKKEMRKMPQGKKMYAFSYIDGIYELMDAADILISKPGGITTSEALAKGLPMIIINPIPGQEAMNTEYLIKNNLAVKVDDPHDTGVVVEELLYNRAKLDEISRKARAFSKPDSARTIATHVLSEVS